MPTLSELVKEDAKKTLSDRVREFSISKNISKISPLGSGYGTSKISNDPYTGKPTLTYQETIPKTFLSPEKTINFEDTTRVAPIFDFTKAQPITRDILRNGRLPESASSAIRAQLGAGYDEQLDHQIALTLSGSNVPENLKVISTSENQSAGTKETQLANDVIAGKISLLDAQKQIAKEKGFSLPEEPKKTGGLLGGLVDKVKNWLLNTPDILVPFAQTQKDITDNFKKSFTDVVEIEGIRPTFPDKILEAGWNTIQDSVQNFVQSAVNLQQSRTPSETSGNALKLTVDTVNAVITPIASAFNMVLELPGLSPARDIMNKGFEAVSNLAQDTAKNVINVIPNSVIDIQAKKNLSEGIGTVMNTIAQFGIFEFIGGKIKDLKTVEKIDMTKPEIDNVISESTKTQELKPLFDKPDPTPIDVRDIPKDMTIGQLREAAQARGWNIPEKTAQVSTDFLREVFTETAKEIAQNKTITPESSKRIINTAKQKVSDTIKTELTGKNIEPIEQTQTTKTSGIAKVIEAKAIEDKIVSSIQDKAQYDPGTFKKWAENAVDLVNRDVENARSIVRGEKILPDNIKEPFLIEAMQEYARKTKNPDIIYELANSPLASSISESAQTLGGARIIERDSAYKRLAEVKKFREEQLSRRTKETTSTVQKKLSESIKIKGENISVEKLNKFIDEIIC